MMVDIDDFSWICAQATDKAYEALPDLGEQDQDAVWEHVAQKIGCEKNIVMNSAMQNELIADLTFDDLVQYYKEAAVEVKFDDMIAAINDADSYHYNLNETNIEYFNHIMTLLTPDDAITMGWTCTEENGHFSVDLKIYEPQLDELARNSTSNKVHELEAAFERKITARYYQLAKCQTCGKMYLEAPTPNERQRDQNSVHFHEQCGYPAGAMKTFALTETPQYSEEMAVTNIPTEVRVGEIWKALNTIYEFEDGQDPGEEEEEEFD